ncbi:MAG TPA: type II CAAX endopeptidase family protein [Actinomycetota bacterium]|nr:type II CAAX endopeptidase family protein [Actinomycetota bacterium]
MSAELPPPPRPDVDAEPSTEERQRRPAPWGALEAIPVFVIALVIAGIGGLIAGLAAHGGCHLGDPTSACGATFVLISLSTELGFLLSVVLWVRVVKRAPLQALGIPGRPIRDVAFGLLSGLGLFVVSIVAGIVVLTLARAILGHEPTQPEQIPTYVQRGTLFWSGLVVVLAAPLGEETFFRGFLFRGLRRRFSLWPAVLISAAAFAVVHGSPILIFALFPVGIGLALIYERRQSPVASMAAHAMFNLIGMLLIAANR